MNQFVKRLKFVKLYDVVQLFPMLLGFLISVFFRFVHRNIWLVCERREDARDNGYWFFRYLCENHPEIEAVYAIDKNSPDYVKVASLGKVIQFGSLTHWVYYWTAKRNISSQKEGKPNAAICFILEVYLGCRKNRVYLKHGITKDDQKWIYYNVTKMNLFICSAIPEYEFVKERFGYPKGTVQLCGLSRFDNLLNICAVKKQILIMPTHREWLSVPSSNTLKYEGTYDFTKSEFFISWNNVIHSKKLLEILDIFDMKVVFYLHASMQKYQGSFKDVHEKITIGTAKEYDVQKLLMESSVLVTDYSSIYMDFAYMQKPLVYYHFDYEKYRSCQYQEGYFSYENDGFGPIAYNEEQLYDFLGNILSDGAKMEKKYIERVRNFYAFRDTNNRERTYNAILSMK